MTLLRNDYLSLWWVYPDFLAEKIGGETFFIFVEESGPVAPEGLTGPDDRPFDADVHFEAVSMRSWRIRASGIDAKKFLVSAAEFEELDHDDVSGDQRLRRRDQLNALYGEQPLPIFDLYFGDKDKNYQFLRAIVVPGAWYWIVVRRRSIGDPGLPIFIGAPELAAGAFMPGTLEFLEAVPLLIEYRLRDIFSLIHVPDAAFGEESGGEGEPLTPAPSGGRDERYEAPAQQYWQATPTMSSGD